MDDQVIFIARYVLVLLNRIGISRQNIQIEADMTAVERILEYCSLDQEPPAQVQMKNRPPTQWPSQGRIVVDHVSMSYSNDEYASLA
jgi:ABC-type multidrug transport system fused ATPase/permease subunit